MRSPNSSRLEKYKTLSDFINGWLTIVAIFAAGLFSLNEYLEHKTGEQVQRSLNYVERYNGDKLLDMRNTLSTKLDEENKSLVETLSNPELSQNELQAAYDKLILEIIKKHKLAIQIKTLLGFHEELVLCVESQLCDEQVARDFFTTDAKALFRGFYPYICDQRRKWKNEKIGLRVEIFFNKNAEKICT